MANSMQRNWLQRNKWLLLRRFSQLSILALFLIGPILSIWVVKGNLSSSITLEVLPLTDPYLLLQTIFTGQGLKTIALIGGAIVLFFYFIVGGRVYCSWVCPVNIVTDAAQWLRVKLGIKGSVPIDRNIRFWMLGMSLLLSSITGMIIWEFVNPVSMLFRGLVFGLGTAWLFVLAVFLLDFAISQRAWCGRVCPVGAFYNVVGKTSLIKLTANKKKQCDDCGDCYVVCPEPQMLTPILKKKDNNELIVKDSACTNCGRCIDVCDKDVFEFKTRFYKIND
jgi:ferredoxin-type protein NapH